MPSPRNATDLNQALIPFLARSTSPFHAVAQMTDRLAAAGFRALDARARWQLEPGQNYYLTRNQSSLVAFRTGKSCPAETGIRLIGAHTDSPCLKLVPNTDLASEGCSLINAEPYGGLLMNPLFDRDLSLAGRVSCQRGDGRIEHLLVDFETPLAVIPSLAIHLDSHANENRTVSAQQHLRPVWALTEDHSFAKALEARVRRDTGDEQVCVLGHELYFYDTQPPAIIGLGQDMLMSARLDNLLSCFTGLQALLDHDRDNPALLVCNDHEEVGSDSWCGAGGSFLQDVLERWIPDTEKRQRTYANSLMISADGAHACHPNYADRHDPNHNIRLNTGPAIKVNAKQAYATNSMASSLVLLACHQAGIRCQHFASHSDRRCGSTIGPISSTRLGICTLDMGAPQWSMHSCREITGSQDPWLLYRALAATLAIPAIDGTP